MPPTPEFAKDVGLDTILVSMLAPEDPRAWDTFIGLVRDELRAAGYRKIIAEGFYEPTLLERWLLDRDEVSERHVPPKAGLRFLHGLMAGAVLGFVLACAATPKLKHYASVGAAIRALSDPKLRGTGVENFRQNIWPTYRPVAHLWAAFGSFGCKGWDYGFEELEYFVEHWSSSSDAPLPRDPFEPRWKACLDRPHEFMALSEILRRQGVSWVPPHGRAPVLDENESWRLPKGHPALALIPDMRRRLTFEPPDRLIDGLR